MIFSNLPIKALLAIVSLLASVTLAFAAPAVATGAVNVRTGPGTSFSKVDTLFKGEHVEVTECKSGWCHVEHSGPDGWVSGNYLAAAGSNGNGSNGSDDPDVNFSFGVGPDGPSFSISIGDPPPAPPVAARACFYNLFNYGGANFCANAGSSDNKLTGSWNDRISSVKVFGGATVTLCRNWYYGGYCRTFSSNENALGAFLNNKGSSFKVY